MELQELEAIIKLCRKLGVATISIGGVTLTLTAEAPVSPYKRRGKAAKPDPFLQAMAESKDAATRAKAKYMQQNPDEQDNQTVTGAPSELDMLLWSAGGGDGAGGGLS